MFITKLHSIKRLFQNIKNMLNEQVVQRSMKLSLRFPCSLMVFFGGGGGNRLLVDIL